MHGGDGPLTDLLTRAVTEPTYAITNSRAADELDERGPLTALGY